MKRRHALTFILTLALVGGAVGLERLNQPAGSKMAEAASAFLASLPDDLRSHAEFSIEDKELINWHFIPRIRKGLPLRMMSEDQRTLVKNLIKTGMSAKGFDTALAIMALEGILNQLESEAGARRFARDPLLYYVSIFGKPGAKGAWAWRIEGHHLALNFHIKDGVVVSSTPVMFGANPAKVLKGEKAGLRTLPSEEDVARELYTSLDGPAKKDATIAENALPMYGDVLSGTQNAKPAALPEVGVAFGALSASQKGMLEKLIQTYVGRLEDGVANQMLSDIKSGGLDEAKFAWAGSAEPGKPSYYRIQSKSFIIEYSNSQNNSNHIHSLLRRTEGEFGQ